MSKLSELENSELLKLCEGVSRAHAAVTPKKRPKMQFSKKICVFGMMLVTSTSLKLDTPLAPSVRGIMQQICKITRCKTMRVGNSHLVLRDSEKGAGSACRRGEYI